MSLYSSQELSVGLYFSNVECFIYRRRFAHNNLDINAFIVFVLAWQEWICFLTEEFSLFDMFSHAVVDEACRAANIILLITAVTRELVHCISS